MAVQMLPHRSRRKWRLFLFLTAFLAVVMTVGICFSTQNRLTASTVIPAIAVEYGEPPPLVLVTP